MISKATVSALIDKAEEEFEKCWEVLCRMKGASSEQLTGEDLLNFQVDLARILFELDGLYKKLFQEGRNLVGKKTSLSKSWFINRQRTIKQYKTALRTAISTGKFLGDLFAWFFYSNELELLKKHMSQEEQPFMPPGIGGKGEFALLNALKVVKGHLLLYHNTSTILREGDFSFVELESQRVRSIVELKSREVSKGGGIDTSVTLIALENKFLKPFDDFVREHASVTDEPSEEVDILSPEVRNRLRQQIESIASALRPAEPTEKFDRKTRLHVDELQELIEVLKKSSVSYMRVGDGLLLCALRNHKAGLSKRLLDSSSIDWQRKVRGVEKRVPEIMDPESKDNDIIFDSIPYKALHDPGMTPFFWWPVNEDFTRMMIFFDAMFVTLYNPAHFIRKLRHAGFGVVFKRETQEMEVSRRIGNSEFIFGNMGFYLNLIMHQFYPEDTIVCLLCDLSAMAEAKGIPPNTRININIVQRIT